MMKKFAAVLLTFLMVMSLVACGKDSKPETVDTEQAVTSTSGAVTEPIVTSTLEVATKLESGEGEAANPGTVLREQETGKKTIRRREKRFWWLIFLLPIQQKAWWS
jgi:hypothetical protein